MDQRNPFAAAFRSPGSGVHAVSLRFDCLALQNSTLPEHSRSLISLGNFVPEVWSETVVVAAAPWPDANAYSVITCSASHPDPLHLIEAYVVAPSIVELGGARACMIGHGGGVLECITILQVSGDARGSETVIVDLGREAGSESAAANHRVGIRLGEGSDVRICMPRPTV